jgi:mandelamide amidase
MVRNTGPSALAGLPGLSLPAGLTRQGLPVGVELDGPPDADSTLLSVGQLFETVIPPLAAPAPPAQQETARHSAATEADTHTKR